MKKIYSYLAVGCLSLSLSGCLDMEPVSVISEGKYWQSPEQFSAFNVGLHGLLRERSHTIFVWGEPRADIYSGTPFTGEAPQGWERLWQNTMNQMNPVISNFGNFYVNLNQINLMIENTENTSVLDEATKKYYLGTAYGMRAYIFFHLLRTYGKCVVNLEPTIGTGINIGQTSKAESDANAVMEQITKDITASETNFGENYEFKDLERSYWSLAATKMLKGEVYLWKGKTDGGGTTDFGTAKQAFEDVKKADVTLGTNYKEIFAYDKKEKNQEIIFTIHNGRNEYDLWGGQYGGTLVMNKQNTSNLYLANGTKVQESELKDMSGLIRFQINPELSQNLFKEGDKRKESTFKNIYKKEGNNLIFQSPVAYKFQGILLDGSNERSWLDNFPIYRYADCLLGLAEAKIFLGEDPTNEINAVRERAYGKEYFAQHNELAYPNDNDAAFYSNNKFVAPDNAGAIEAVLKERMREFVFEGKRWYDLRLMGKEYVTKYSSASEDRMLWPIDENSLGENDALKQTPGYEVQGKE